MECSASYIEELKRSVEEVKRWDIETLTRLYSDDELVELWNDIRRNLRIYLRNCSNRVDPDIDSFIRGEFQFAQLLIATAFKQRGVEKPGITDRFRDEEYEVIMDFEKYKIFDKLDIDRIVEYIERREGKVYEFIREYYSKQYNALDRAWGHLLGSMMEVIENRYMDRRKKMEEAVLEYIRRRGLEATLFEIEEVVKKAVEVGRLRREFIEREELLRGFEERVMDEISRLRSEVAGVIEGLRSGRSVDVEEVVKRYEEVEKDIHRYASMLRELLKRLGVEKEELERMGLTSSTREVVDAEIHLLSSMIDSIEKRLREYDGLVKSLEVEKEALRNRVVELEKVLSGVEEGAVVTIDEARGLVESYLSRLYSRLRDRVEIYNPVEDRVVRISGWDVRDLYSGGVCSNRLLFVKRKGLIGRRDYVVVEAYAIVHEDTLASKGFDAEKAGLGEVLSIISSRIHYILSSDHYHILVIASPTGFSSKALEFITSGEYYKRFALKNLSIYLVDLLEGRLYYNEVDETTVRNKDFVELEYPWESIKRVVDYMVSEEAILEANRRGPPPYLPIDYIVEKTGVSRQLVRVALERLASSGRGRVSRLSSGKTVFIYRGGV